MKLITTLFKFNNLTMSIQLTLAYDKEKLDTKFFFPIFYVNDDIFIQPISTRHFHFVKMSLIRRGKKIVKCQSAYIEATYCVRFY